MTPKDFFAFAEKHEGLAALAEDHAFLTKGGVFTDDLIETRTAYKVENEVKPLSLRPTPTSSSCFTTDEEEPRTSTCPPTNPRT